MAEKDMKAEQVIADGMMNDEDLEEVAGGMCACMDGGPGPRRNIFPDEEDILIAEEVPSTKRMLY